MMSKFLNTKTLIILLVVLGAILVITELTKREDRSFRSQLVDIDTAQVTKIEIIPKIGGGDMITMTRNGYDWKLESGGKVYQQDNATIRNILTELARLRVERVAATGRDKWTELEVTDSTATRIKLYNDDDLLSDLYLGKFSYSQPEQANPYQRQQARMFTHVWPAEDEKVYVVEGFIKMNIQPKVDSYRAKILCNVDPQKITRVKFDYPDLDFTVEKTDSVWMVDGQVADSTKTARFMNKFRRLTSSNFIDDVEPQQGAEASVITVEAEGISPVVIKALPADSVNQYVITSSKVADAKYSGSKGRLYDRIFVQPDEFLPDEKKK